MYSKTIEDEVLGNFVWDDKLNCWDGMVEIFPGHELKYMIVPKDENEETVLETCRKTLITIKNLNDEHKKQFSGKFVKLYNDTWSEGEKIDSESLIEKVKLSEATFYSNGRADLYYNCGDLFQGHVIEVRLDENGAIRETGLTG